MGVLWPYVCVSLIARRAKWSVCLGGLVSLLVSGRGGQSVGTSSIHSERTTFHSNYFASRPCRHMLSRKKQMTSACGSSVGELLLVHSAVVRCSVTRSAEHHGR